MLQVETIDNSTQINEAFSRQSVNFDDEDLRNPLLQKMRSQVYKHISAFIKRPCHVLELNAGTGIDAVHFARQGHRVHATDISDGMVEQINRKAKDLHGSLTVQQLSFNQLDKLSGQKFDFVFSNFGGLNCTSDLARVTSSLPEILNPNGFVTLVIMPKICVWEILTFFYGNPNAFRRFNKNGTIAHLEGVHFRVWYHSLRSIKKAFGPDFRLVRHEGLVAIVPPPHIFNFPSKHPVIYRALERIDAKVKNHFPFNRWADHIIVSFQLVRN